MSRRLLILIPALMALTWMSCTTKRDGRAYRLYHNTTAKYNGFFYANEAHAEAEVKLEELHDERWDEILPLFLESDEESAQQIFPLMERAIEKCTRVVDRHTMAPPKRMTKSFSRPVMNKWIDDNYTVIGKSYYLKGDYPKAEEIFTYLARTVNGDVPRRGRIRGSAGPTCVRATTSRPRTLWPKPKASETPQMRRWCTPCSSWRNTASWRRNLKRLRATWRTQCPG